jgi:hypothetical protein
MAGLAILLVAALAGQYGCTDPQAKKNEALRKEIIEVHDRAMDKIGVMFELEMKLKNDPPPGLSREIIDRRVAALQQANRAMFAWMNQYQTLAVDADIEVDTRYRIKQLDLIKEVSRMTDQAIAEAGQMKPTD